MGRAMTKSLILFVLPFAVMLCSRPAVCANAKGGWEDAGVRIGFQAGPKSENFHQYELSVTYGLPFEWRNLSGFGVAPKLNAAAGVLDGGGDTGFIGSVGTSLLFDKTGIGLKPEVGINANLLNKNRFGRQDYGSMLQFGAFIGVIYRFESGLGIEYRLQHISNGHIFYTERTPNPGLDLHMIGLSWLF